MFNPVQIAILVFIVAAFATFGVTLLAVSIYANLAEKQAPKPLPRTVIPASRHSTPVLH